MDGEGMGRRKVLTGTPLPKALACGMLEDNGRVLFLVRRDMNGTERIEMPCILVASGRSPFAEIKSFFQKATGIDAEIHEIALEGRYNAGSRKRRNMVPVLAFRVSARNRTTRPMAGFSGFRWLSLDDARKQRLARNCEWLLRARKPSEEDLPATG